MVDAISPYAVEAGKFNNTGSNPVLTTNTNQRIGV